jgi:hypothetical protein
MSALGNVLGTSGFQNKYEETIYAAVSRPVWATIRSAFGTTSDRGFTTMLRHMNYDYFTNTVKHCGEAGEPGCQGGDASVALPPSLYRATKPSWFGGIAWPPIGPDVAGYANKIPAQIRFEGGIIGVKSPRCTRQSCGSLRITSLTSTTIEFESPEPGPVTLTLFNASGKLIQKTTLTNINAGRHKVALDGKQHSPRSVHIIRLKAGEAAATEKAIIEQ